MWIKITIKTTSQVENSIHFISTVKAEVSNTFRNMKNSSLLCLIFFSGNIMYKKNIKGSFSVIDSLAGRAWACWLHWNKVHSLSALHSQHCNKTCPWDLSSTNIWWHKYCRKRKKKKKSTTKEHTHTQKLTTTKTTPQLVLNTPSASESSSARGWVLSTDYIQKSWVQWPWWVRWAPAHAEQCHGDRNETQGSSRRPRSWQLPQKQTCHRPLPRAVSSDAVPCSGTEGRKEEPKM